MSVQNFVFLHFFPPDVKIFHWISENVDLLVSIGFSRIHPLGTVNISTEIHGSPCSNCLDVEAWLKTKVTLMFKAHTLWKM